MAEPIFDPPSIAREQKIPTLVADSNDEAALNALTKRTKVVVTTVGPYAKVRVLGMGGKLGLG